MLCHAGRIDNPGNGSMEQKVARIRKGNLSGSVDVKVTSVLSFTVTLKVG